MKHFLCLIRPRLLALFVCLAIGLSTSPAGALEVELPIRERILDNGVQVLVLERPNLSGRVAARIFYKVDITAERPGTSGLTHMLEHLLFKGSHFLGTTDWEAEREVAERVERLAREMEDEKNRLRDFLRQREVLPEYEVDYRTQRLDALTARYLAARDEQDERFTIALPDRIAYMAVGATGLTASTGRDWMKFDADLPANRLEAFMWIERSRVDTPVFRHFDPEKEVVIEQVRGDFLRADAAFNRSLRAMTYEANPYGWYDWFSDLNSATREDLWEIYHRFFIPQNTILVVVGDITAEKVFEMSERYWGDWPPARHAPRLRTVEPAPVGERRLTSRASAGPIFRLNVPAPAVGHPDIPALNVLAELLSGSTGLLMRRLGDDLEIASSASASLWLAKHPSHFSVTVLPRSNDDLQAVEREVVAVLERITRGEVEELDMAGAVRDLTFRYAAGFEEPGNAAVTIGSIAAIHHWRHVNEIPRLWAEVTLEDLVRVVTLYFKRDHWVVGHLLREDPVVAGLEEKGTELRAAGKTRRYEGDNTLTSVRPGSWPAGGPVEEFTEPLHNRIPLVRARSIGADFVESALSDPVRGKDLSEFADALPPNPEVVAGKWNPAKPQRELHAGEPIPVAEGPWFAPPWMAYRTGILEPVHSTRPQTLNDIRYPPQPLFKPPAPETYEVTTPSGLRAFVAPSSGLPLVRASLFLDLSQHEDPAGREGLREVVRDLLMESGGGALDFTRRRMRMDALGISASVSTEEHRLRFDFLAPAEVAEELVEMLAELVVHPLYDEATFRQAQRRVAARAERAKNDPWTVVHRIFSNAAFGEGHHLARHPTPSSVRAIRFDEVETTLREALVGARMGLALSGAVTPEASGEWIRSAFQKLPQGKPAPRIFISTPEPRPSTVVTAQLDSVKGFVKMGYPSFRGIPEDHAAFELANYILVGAAQGGHLFQLIRTKLGLTAAVYGEADPRLDGPATYEIRFAGNPPTVAEAIRQTCRKMEEIRIRGLTEEELIRAKAAYLEGHVPSVYRTPHMVAQRLVEKAIFGRYDYVRTHYHRYYAGDDDQMEAIRLVTLEEVNAAARRYFRPDKMIVAVAGPLDTIREGTEAFSGKLETCDSCLDRFHQEK